VSVVEYTEFGNAVKSLDWYFRDDPSTNGDLYTVLAKTEVLEMCRDRMAYILGKLEVLPPAEAALAETKIGDTEEFASTIAAVNNFLGTTRTCPVQYCGDPKKFATYHWHDNSRSDGIIWLYGGLHNEFHQLLVSHEFTHRVQRSSLLFKNQTLKEGHATGVERWYAPQVGKIAQMCALRFEYEELSVACAWLMKEMQAEVIVPGPMDPLKKELLRIKGVSGWWEQPKTDLTHALGNVFFQLLEREEPRIYNQMINIHFAHQIPALGRYNGRD
jgi:hypothetical protein